MGAESLDHLEAEKFQFGDSLGCTKFSMQMSVPVLLCDETKNVSSKCTLSNKPYTTLPHFMEFRGTAACIDIYLVFV